MQAQSVVCLSKEQIKLTLNNWMDVLNLSNPKIIKSEHNPEFSQETMQKYGLPHITKFADWYQLIRAEDANKKPYFFFVIEATRFDKLFLSAIIGYWHLIKEEVEASVDPEGRPHIFVCPAYVVTESMMIHTPISLIPHMYRFVSLCEIYPRLGSEKPFGFVSELQLLPKSTKARTGYEFAEIYDNDVDVIIVNGLPGEVLKCRRVLFEGVPYSEFYYRRIISTVSNIKGMNQNGICGWEKDKVK
jgi:hypothetical protein